MACQTPPRAVGMPRVFNAVANSASVVIPEACICLTTGRTLTANASAAAWLAAPPFADASARLVLLPSCAPLAFIAPRAAFVLAAMMARSRSAHRIHPVRAAVVVG